LTVPPRPILFINPAAGMSGAEFSLLGLMENLDPERFTPILVVPEEGMLASNARHAGITTLILPAFIRFGEGYRPRTIPKAGRALLGLRKIIRANGIRIVHSNSPRAAYLGGAAARLCAVPSVIHVRDIHLSPFSSAWKARLLGRLSDLIIAVSAATRSSVIAKAPSLASKAQVVYTGLDLNLIDGRPAKNARAELGIDPEDPVIASAGILHPAKGQGVLLRAAALLKTSFPTLRILIVGAARREAENDYRQRLEALAVELGLAESVVFTGFREDVLDLMAASDVFVHPAVYPEPFARSLLEALALRLPVVATRTGGIPEIVEDGRTGLLAEPSDPRSLAEAIGDLLRDREKALRLGFNGRRKVESEFTIEKHVSALSEMYERLLTPS
jgi:glycosyltransferase involved in cell wall biosynthesis